MIFQKVMDVRKVFRDYFPLQWSQATFSLANLKFQLKFEFCKSFAHFERVFLNL